MSGDVFGNGMLLSEQIRLVAAYDHRHVFIDPDPDPAAGFAERERLFALPGSSWDDYDRAAISEGGGVWPRAAKSIPLSEQARAALGVEDERMAPADVIRAILRAPVDLLFNGGIGTVVKASDESDDDAQDRASDAIRVDAADLRCRAVGEGGNLGLTRRARVEYAAGGGLVFADFIDNSAGVDCSDHEVNLKILLGLAERRGELDRPARDELLLAVTDDVVAHVLYDSFLQAQILAQEVAVARDRMYAYEDLMVALEAGGLLDRGSEGLPGAEEIAERRRAGRGLERPELALLLAYAKRSIARDLLASDLCEDPWLEDDLRSYFPGPVVERFGHLLAEHPLRRELIATVNANLVANSLGPTYASQLGAERGADAADVVRAFRVAREVTGADARWDAIEQLPRGLDRAVADELMRGVDRLVDAATRWYLAHDGREPLEERIATAEAPFARLVAVLPEIGGDEWRAQRREAADGLVGQGVPEDVAWAHACLPELMQAPDIIAVARHTGREVEEVTRAYHVLAERLDIVWLLGSLEELPAADAHAALGGPGRARGLPRRARGAGALRARRGAGGPGRRGRRRRLPRGPRRPGAAPARGDRLADRRGDRRPARADARRAGAEGLGRLMPNLVLGPLLRYAGADDATIWVETDGPCEVEVLGCREPTFRVGGHHYALVHVTGLERAATIPTRCGSTARASGRRT